MERIEIVARQRAINKGPLKPFAKKLIDSALRPLAEILTDFAKDIGIEKIGRADLTQKIDVIERDELSTTFDIQDESILSFDGKANMGDALQGEIIRSQMKGPEDTYTSVQNKGTHAMHLRLEHLFDKVELYFNDAGEDIPEYVKLLDSTAQDTGVKLTSKPVVIGDALPFPEKTPDSVEQLLEAALAHHNLGGYEESLKFLEAARVQLIDWQWYQKKQELKNNPNTKMSDIENLTKQNVRLPIEVYVYIGICKGNVYQSCGDDENSMITYFDCLSKSIEEKNVEWEMVSINCIGMLAYYNMKYELALKCFSRVVSFRVKEYGEGSADTATSWNNQACCLFALNIRGEARAFFEKSWSQLCKTLGHRHPRSLATWKNLEKARRNQRSMTRKDFGATLSTREDADRLLLGGEFTINAIPPPGDGPKKGGKKKGKGKKKK